MRPMHRLWLQQEGLRLLEFYRASRLPDGGFAPLDVNGALAEGALADTLVTARHTHVYALAAIEGLPGAASLAAHGIRALETVLRDDEHGGWYQRAPGDSADFDASKQCYIQVFVALGAASASQAEIPGARQLLAAALAVLEKHFWSPESQAYCESYNRDWSQRADYRGANSNMHAVELCLELADVLADNSWRERALAIAERLIHRHAAANDYLVVEHFHGDWREWRDCNAEAPEDGFYPYGATPGHGCEWARLLLNLEAGLRHDGHDAPPWLLEDAQALFHKSVTVGWHTDGHPGMLYTVDWQGLPCAGRRRHWVAAETLAAAAALAQRTGEPAYEAWYRRVWDHVRDVFIDTTRGSWHQELDAELAPHPDEGHLKADLYHAYQATRLPTLALAPTLPVAVGMPVDAHTA
ncbi:AGE family epimerase/isomerase [Salinisphaera sp. Q1T1-3]|uniref:AGE family epimerase/isomerase n=1 Tax=Salinisphaera sp. Q1T1-3 TaxID=2321229 RepID=UPI000E71CFA5|nr:sugar isomerase [Salinisphaera sp. Q1T1-3]